jgi:hypothetical protein
MPQATHLPMARRKRVLDAARDLARSGQHLNHQSIMAHLERMEGFAEAGERLRDIRGQRIGCALWRSPGGPELRSQVGALRSQPRKRSDRCQSRDWGSGRN